MFFLCIFYNCKYTIGGRWSLNGSGLSWLLVSTASETDRGQSWQEMQYQGDWQRLQPGLWLYGKAGSGRDRRGMKHRIMQGRLGIHHWVSAHLQRLEQGLWQVSPGCWEKTVQSGIRVGRGWLVSMVTSVHSSAIKHKHVVQIITQLIFQYIC